MPTVPHKLALLPRLQLFAGENQVQTPLIFRHLAARRPRDKVVNVGPVLIPAFETDRRIAVKAAAFFGSRSGCRDSWRWQLVGYSSAKELLFGGIIFQAIRLLAMFIAHLFLNASGVRFSDQVLVLLALRQRIKVVGQSDTLMRFTLVDKSAWRFRPDSR